MHADSQFLSLAVAGGGIALALASAVWALAERQAARVARQCTKMTAMRMRAAIGLRDALLEQGADGVVAWDVHGRKTFSQHAAEVALRASLDGPDGSALSAALERLDREGTAFTHAGRDQDGQRYVIRGNLAAGAPAVWIAEENEADEAVRRLASLLDAIPIPIWLRDASLALRWANRAFLAAVSADTIARARARGAALDRSEPDFAAQALAEGAARETGRYSLVRGMWRSFTLTHVPLESGEVAGVALDVSDAAEAELRLKRQIQNQALVIDRFPAAIAVFGADRKLETYNAAFAMLWSLPREWLDAGPTHEALLDRLREARKLPERRDYQAWKRQRLALHGGGSEAAEERWALPDGRTLRVSFANNPAGGASILFEDVTERLELESSFKMRLTAQAATLDALSEAVAAFGPDGRLALHNAAFASMWEIDAATLVRRPHIREVADLCLTRFGDEATWDRLVATLTSSPAQRRDWRKMHRSDASVLSLTTMPLPDRATLVAFADVTDRYGIEAATRERNHALETLERLRADYMRQLSYELRTPLNTVLGFAEQLASDGGETLGGQAPEQIKAIHSGAEALKSVVDGMLANLAGDGAVRAVPPERPRMDERRRKSG